MTKSGLVALWNAKYEIKGNDCLFPLVLRAGDVKKIGLSHMVGCFFVLSLGLITGIISLVVEIVKQRKNLKTAVASEPKHLRNGKHSDWNSKWLRLNRIYHKIKTGKLYENWMPNASKLQQPANGVTNVHTLAGYNNPDRFYHNSYGEPRTINRLVVQPRRFYYPTYQSSIGIQRNNNIFGIRYNY